MNYKGKDLLVIEESLNSVSFQGILVGGLTRPFQITILRSKISRPSILSRIRRCLSEMHFFLSALVRGYRHQKVPNRSSVVFGYVRATDRYFKFFQPLFAHFDQHNIIFINHRRDRRISSSNEYFVDIHSLNLNQYIAWRRSFKQITPQLQQVYLLLKQDIGLKKHEIRELHHCIRTQTRNCIVVREVFVRARPKFVLADFDRSKYNSCQILTANALGIPTFSFIHGSTEPPLNYIPVLAKRLLCWGNIQFKQFSELPIPKRRYVISGNHWLKPPPKSRYIRKGVSGVVRVALATTKSKKYGQFFFSLFAEATRDTTVESIVKLHPLETREQYLGLLNENKHVSIVEFGEKKNSDFFLEIDLLIVHSSVVITEGISFGVPVLVINPDVNYPIGIGKHLVNLKGYPQIKNMEHLRRYLLEVQRDASILDNLYAMNLDFMYEYCAYYGQESLQKTLAFLNENTE